jgi:hypothetical protein
METELNELLKQVDGLFKHKKEKYGSYAFDLARYNSGIWCFNVVNSWQMWGKKKLETKFYGYTPQEAIKGFLNYVKKKKIKIEKLRT